MENKGITPSIVIAITLYVIGNGIVNVFAYSDFKPKCLANGGVYGETVSSINIVSQTCTYSKGK